MSRASKLTGTLFLGVIMNVVYSQSLSPPMKLSVSERGVSTHLDGAFPTQVLHNEIAEYSYDLDDL